MTRKLQVQEQHGAIRSLDNEIQAQNEFIVRLNEVIQPHDGEIQAHDELIFETPSGFSR